MTWFYATSVTVANGQTVVAVNSGDDIQLAQSAGGLIIGTQPAVEIKRTFLDGSSNKKIELSKPWPYGTQTNQPAMAFPTDGDLAAATAVLKQLIDGFTLATQAEAQAGTDNTKPMTALRVKQAMDALLGSAAKLTATVNEADRTNGRALKVGDHGLGATFRGRVDVLAGQTPVEVATIYGSDYAYNGTILNHGGAAPTPFGILSGYITANNSYSYAYQDFTDIYGGKWTRTAQVGGGAWNSWTINYAGNNAVGPVSFSGGISTGSIIERGANANGEYVKLADGTAFAWGRAIVTGVSINPAGRGNSASGYLCDPVMPTVIYDRVLNLGQRALYDAGNSLIYSVEAASTAGLPIILNLGSRPADTWPRLDEIGITVAVKVDYFWFAAGRWR